MHTGARHLAVKLALGLGLAFIVSSPTIGQQAWYWIDVVQNDSVAGGDVVVHLMSASDFDTTQNVLGSANLDFEFDTTQIEYVEFLESEFTLHNDSTAVYDIYDSFSKRSANELGRLLLLNGDRLVS